MTIAILCFSYIPLFPINYFLLLEIWLQWFNKGYFSVKTILCEPALLYSFPNCFQICYILYWDWPGRCTFLSVFTCAELMEEVLGKGLNFLQPARWGGAGRFSLTGGRLSEWFFFLNLWLNFWKKGPACWISIVLAHNSSTKECILLSCFHSFLSLHQSQFFSDNRIRVKH